MLPFGTVNSNPLYTNSPTFETFALFDMLIISMVLLFYGINKYATTHISDWNFKASLSSDISTFEMDFIFWTNPVFSFVCLDTIIAKPTSAIFELLSVE